MTIFKYFILDWIGCGIFTLFALIWLFGLITSQPRLRFACDFFMVGALFIMLIGFGGRHKQVLIQKKRQAPSPLSKKITTKPGKNSGKTA